MRLDLSYLGQTEVRTTATTSALAFAPNLSRPRVFYDAELVHPVRFREAVSALHEVVVGDLRFRRKDRTAYEQWKKQQAEREAQLRRAVMDVARREELARIVAEPLPEGIELDFKRMHDVYWRARRQWAAELSRSDPEMFRHLVPCDPVVTVAPDAVFFECFSKDESSYGCLLVDREGFRGEATAELGTTNVDYSLGLYEHFQTLRSYRETRLLVDPTGFEVQVGGNPDYREEKIDLPPSWLRGFGALQAAMGLPSRRVVLGVEAVYSILAFLRRHREKTGPRSIRFQLEPGRPAKLVLDPWGVEVASRGSAYDGERAEEIKIWGRRRLLVLARTLPLAERVEVAVLGSGLPSVWTVFMGEMKLVVALSGWTSNDWTSSGALELMTAARTPDPALVPRLERHLAACRSATLDELSAALGGPRDSLLGSLGMLARQGQVMYDFAHGRYRYRPVMPVALSDAVLGPEPAELVQGRRLHRERLVSVQRQEALPSARRLFVGTVEKTECEAILDVDGSLVRARCPCSHFFKNRLRGGPCRHLLALQLTVRDAAGPQGMN